VIARHEIRPVLDIDTEHIFFKPHDAHLAFRDEVPSPLPDALTNTERQLVCNRRMADALLALEEKIEIHPVRLVDRAGATVSTDYVVVSPKRVVNCIESGGEMVGGYLHGSIQGLSDPTVVPPVFRVGYSLLIACSDDAAAKLGAFTGLELVPFPSYVEEFFPFPPAPYELLYGGTEGAQLELITDDDELTEQLEKGVSLATSWPETASAKMKGPKSRKKIVDFTDAGAAPLITAKARKVLEPFGLGGVELLPIREVKDHAGKVVKGDHWLLHVTGTQSYVDVDESDIEVIHGLLWSAREIVVDESRLTARPAFFRVPGARYPWVFVRRDVIDALHAAKLTGFRTEHPAKHSYSVEGGGLRSVC
jgi:hypothetical protein